MRDSTIEIRRIEELIIERFNKQIKRQYRAANGDIDECPSGWQKRLFLISKDLSLNDWREIRKGDYWEIRHNKYDMDRDEFILSRIKQYLKQK